MQLDLQKALFCAPTVYNFLSKNPNPTCNKLTLSPAAKRARRDDDAGADGRIVAQVNDMKVRVLEHYGVSAENGIHLT